MSKQVAKHHRKAARHARAARHGQRVRGRKATRARKPVTRHKHVVGGAAAEQQRLESHVGDQSAKALAAYAEPATDTVEVMEIEVVSVPEESLEVDEAELSLRQESFFEEEE